VLILARFLREPAGTVAVDWMVLTATAVGFGVMVVAALSGGAVDMAGDINVTLANAGVLTLGAP
jgi:hypothetical protein